MTVLGGARQPAIVLAMQQAIGVTSVVAHSMNVTVKNPGFGRGIDGVGKTRTDARAALCRASSGGMTSLPAASIGVKYSAARLAAADADYR